MIIDKPSGMSSFQVLRELRNKFPREKMGYLGTLDPLATGVLVVFIGQATQLIHYFSDADKEYLVDFELGKSSDTYDVTGKINIEDCPVPELRKIEEIVELFLGQQWQVQPNFSAIRYRGKRAYELAREGKKFDLGKRQVIISGLKLLDYNKPFVKLRVVCSGGTYVRSLVHEIGEKLGCGAVMNALRRTMAGPFDLKESTILEKISDSNLKSTREIISDYIDWKGRSMHEREVLLKKFM